MSAPFWRVNRETMPDQRPVHGLRRQAEFLQQLRFADALAAPDLRPNSCAGMQRVGLRAPLAVIHAVQDAVSTSGARAQRAVQAEAVFRRLDLARVGGADGVERVGERDAALDVADPAEELQAVRPEDTRRPAPPRPAPSAETGPGSPGCEW